MKQTATASTDTAAKLAKAFLAGERRTRLAGQTENIISSEDQSIAADASIALDRLIATPADTLIDLRWKARVSRVLGHSHEDLCASICRDLLRVAPPRVRHSHRLT